MNRPAQWQLLSAGLLARRPLRIGGATIDPLSRDASWAGGRERLQPQILKVLLILAGRRGEVVTRDELVQLCWDGRILGEDVINRAISLLRHLSERAGGFEIETVPRTGYRLLETDSPERAVRRHWILASAVVAAIVSATALLLLVRQPGASERATLTVMVLPFTVDTGDPQTRELADDARNSVVRMLGDSGVSVKLADTPGAANDGSVDMVVAGKVATDEAKAVVSLTGEDMARRAVILSRRLQSPKSDIADLPDQVGATIAASLSWTGPFLVLDKQHPSDPVFVEHLLGPMGNEDYDLLRDYEFARRNAPRAPNSAIAQLELAMDVGLLVPDLPQEERGGAVADGRTAADRLVRLAPSFGDVTIPWCLLHPPVRMAECEDHLRAGLKSDPEAPFVGNFLSHLLNKVGRLDEALSAAQTTLAEDQYVPGKISALLWILDADGYSKEADALYRRGSRLWPGVHFFFWVRSDGITERGDFDALEKLEATIGRVNLPPGYESVVPLAEAVKAHSLGGVRAACSKPSTDYRSAQCMLAMAQVGDLDGAFALGQSIYPRRKAPTAAEEQALWFHDPLQLDTAYLIGAGAAPMRRDPRFLPLAERIGLLDYWRSGSGRLPDFCTKKHEPICVKIGPA